LYSAVEYAPDILHKVLLSIVPASMASLLNLLARSIGFRLSIAESDDSSPPEIIDFLWFGYLEKILSYRYCLVIHENI